jgi:hypothetical protein
MTSRNCFDSKIELLVGDRRYALKASIRGGRTSPLGPIAPPTPTMHIGSLP